MGHPDENPELVAARQEALILSLLRSKTKTEAAEKAGVQRSTMYRWFHDRSSWPLTGWLADKILGRAFKAMEAIEVDEELAVLRSIIEELKAASPAAVPDTARYRMTDVEQAEACRLRVAWMGEIGLGARDIESSLRYNRPQSVAEEQDLLDVVGKLLEGERICTCW